MNTISGDAQSFGAGDGLNFFNDETGVPIGKYPTGSVSRHNCAGTPCAFSTALANSFRDPILGIDTGRNAFVMRGLPFWNMDFAVVKNTKITERISIEFHAMFANVFNHMQPSDPDLELGNPGVWGVLDGNAGSTCGGFGTVQCNPQDGPRHIEFGLRVRF